MAGHATFDDYYNEANAIGRLDNITVPTFYMQALDDICVNEMNYPYKEIEANQNLIIGTTKQGAHCCFFTGSIIPEQWFPSPYQKFLNFLESRATSPAAATSIAPTSE